MQPQFPYGSVPQPYGPPLPRYPVPPYPARPDLPGVPPFPAPFDLPPDAAPFPPQFASADFQHSMPPYPPLTAADYYQAPFPYGPPFYPPPPPPPDQQYPAYPPEESLESSIPKQPSDELFERAAITNTYVTYNVLESDSARSSFKINLRIDQYMFQGDGTSMLEAINNACAKALEQGDVFRPAKRIKPDPILGAAAAAAAGAVRPLLMQPLLPLVVAAQQANKRGETPDDEKSPIQPLMSNMIDLSESPSREEIHPDGICETPFTRILDKIIPKDETLMELESLLSSVELVLRNYGRELVVGADEDDNEINRAFKDILRFGLYDKEIMLRGEYEAELAVVCFGRNILDELVNRVRDCLDDQLNLEKENPEFVVERPPETWMVSVQTKTNFVVHVQFTCEGIWQVMEDEEEEEASRISGRIPHKECRRVSAHVRHNEWFKKSFVRRNNQLCAILLIRHICEYYYDTWALVPLYYYEVLVNMCSVLKFQNPPLLWVLKKVMEIVSSGVFMYTAEDRSFDKRRLFEFVDPSKMPVVVTREVWPLPCMKATFKMTCDANNWLRYIANDDVAAIFDFEDYYEEFGEEEMVEDPGAKDALFEIISCIIASQKAVKQILDNIDETEMVERGVVDEEKPTEDKYGNRDGNEIEQITFGLPNNPEVNKECENSVVEGKEESKPEANVESSQTEIIGKTGGDQSVEMETEKTVSELVTQVIRRDVDINLVETKGESEEKDNKPDEIRNDETVTETSNTSQKTESKIFGEEEFFSDKEVSIVGKLLKEDVSTVSKVANKRNEVIAPNIMGNDDVSTTKSITKQDDVIKDEELILESTDARQESNTSGEIDSKEMEKSDSHSIAPNLPTKRTLDESFLEDQQDSKKQKIDSVVEEIIIFTPKTLAKIDDDQDIEHPTQ